MNKTNDNVILEMKSISKHFPGVQALDDVSFVCRRGHIHALVGENGAGKSTLMKILTGAYQPDSGQVIFKGQPQKISHPSEAQELGISIIYQEFNLIPYMSVAENIFIGREPRTSLGLANHQAMREKATALLNQLNVNVDVNAWVRELPVAQQQMVEIAKALSLDADIIIMDEPTAALAETEVQVLFEIVNRLKAMDRSIVFISHRLKEVFQIADDITVLRDGKITAVKETGETSIRQITNLMVGRELEQHFPEKISSTGTEEILTVRDLNKTGVLHDINLTLHKGEIVGIAGLEGHGQRELIRVIFGADCKDSGEVLVEGVERDIRSPREAISAGIAFVSDDRKTEGIILDLSVLHNVALPSLTSRTGVAGFVKEQEERNTVSSIVGDLNVRTPSLEQLTVYLSGGNQQKVVLAKWLVTHPKVILFSEPTRGIDVGAKEEIYRLMRDFAQRGTAILMTSSELGEIMGMSDRVLVMHEGRIVAEFTGEEATEPAIMQAAVGAG